MKLVIYSEKCVSQLDDFKKAVVRSLGPNSDFDDNPVIAKLTSLKLIACSELTQRGFCCH